MLMLWKKKMMRARYPRLAARLAGGCVLAWLAGMAAPTGAAAGQATGAAAVDALMASLSHLWTLVSPSWARDALDQPDSSRVDLVTGWHKHMPIDLRIRSSTTGC